MQLFIFKADGDAHIHVNIFKLATEGVPNHLKIAAFIGQLGSCAYRRFKGNLGSKFTYAEMIDRFFQEFVDNEAICQHKAEFMAITIKHEEDQATFS